MNDISDLNTHRNSIEMESGTMKSESLDGTKTRPFVNGRVVVMSALILTFLVIGVTAMSRVAGTGARAEATDLSEVERAQNDSVKQFADGMVPYADEDPYAGPAVTGWLSVKPSATSLAPEYDTKRKRVPVHSDSGEVIGYDYTYIGFVPLDLADSPSFDEHVVRAEAYGGCDPLGGSETPDTSCLTRDWVKPHAR